MPPMPPNLKVAGCPIGTSSSKGGDIEDVVGKQAAAKAAATEVCNTCSEVDSCDLIYENGVASSTKTQRPPKGSSISLIKYPSFVKDKFLDSYQSHVEERRIMADGFGVAPKPLDAEQVSDLIDELKSIEDHDLQDDPTQRNIAKELLDLLINRVPPGVDEAAYVKATWLSRLAMGEQETSPHISRLEAIRLLGTMKGGYNVQTLIDLLSDPNDDIAKASSVELSNTLLVFDSFKDVETLHQHGNDFATQVLENWANADWFLKQRRPLQTKITLTVFKVQGETNTDDLSPAPDAWSRPDIPLHAIAMLKNPRQGIEPVKSGQVGPLKQIYDLKLKGHPLAYVGDVVGTGSSRKSATNSVLWYIGDDIPYVPNIKSGGFVLGGKIAPIFFNTVEDSGGLPIELDVSNLNMGDVIDIYPYEGVVKKQDEVVSTFQLKTPVLLDEVRAGGRIPLIIGRSLTVKAREALNMDIDIGNIFTMPALPESAKTVKGYTLAQKMVAKACGLPDGQGVVAGQYCEPKMTTVGSQDTTGPMTRDELRSLACLNFSADLVMQSFCHTAAYPKPVDVAMHHTLPGFISTRGGISLKPGDGIIHSWLNRMLLPDTVGTGGDSHTRFPLGISFPAGSGLVAFGAATGIMPLDMPESVLVRFTGKLQPGITLRDVVQYIPYMAIQKGLLTVEKEGKKNIFSGRIIEIEGLSDLKCEQAFELSDATAERSAAGCAIKLNKDSVIEYLHSNVVMLKWMIAEGYGDTHTLERRVARMEEWLENPVLLEADPDAEYAEIIDINLDELNEPVLALPNDPDASVLLSEVANTKIDEVFIGSCMTDIGQFRAAGKLLEKVSEPIPTRLWLAPPTKMDKAQLTEEGYYSIFAAAGARTETPGCSLCMGNQARVAPKSTVVSTSTRNFPNRLGQGANVYLASAELATIASILGRLPTPAEYMNYMHQVEGTHAETYRFLDFGKLPEYVDQAEKVHISDEMKAAAHELQVVESTSSTEESVVITVPKPPSSNHAYEHLQTAKGRIIYTETDEAPALATYALYPILRKVSAISYVDIVPCDISVAGRVLSAFPEYLEESQRVPDNLAYLGQMAANDPQCAIIKLPNISAPINQLQDCIAELRSKGYNVPLYPTEIKTPGDAEVQARYQKLSGSAVNPVLREGNSDRRVARPVKEFVQQHPHRLGAWNKDIRTHVSHMTEGDFYGSEKSTSIQNGPTSVQIVLSPANGDQAIVLKDDLPLEDQEVIDASFISVSALREYYEKEMQDALDNEIMLSLHLKATMMKVSDPIFFGHCITVYFKEAWEKHSETLKQVGAKSNSGLTSIFKKLREALPSDQAESIIADFEDCYKKRPSLAMVNSDKGITNLHAPNDVIIDASMPVVVRDSGKMWNKEGKMEEVKCLIPDRSYARVYQEVFDFVRERGQFDVATMGNVDNVGLMAKKAEEYGSHDKTFEIPKSGIIRVVDKSTNDVYFEHEVEVGDVWRMCQAKDAPIRDWVKLAVRRARATQSKTIFWLDENRAHDSVLIGKVNTYLKEHNTDGLDISIMSPTDAARVSCELAMDGKDAIAVTGNVLRDYLTDLFPILELGTSAKMLSIVPLLAGGGLYETGAGGSAPKHVQQFVEEAHLRWDSLGEYLAMAVAYERLSETSGNPKAKMLGECLMKAVGHMLNHSKSPSRKVNQIDNRGETFYLALYWLDYLQKEDPAYSPLYQELCHYRSQIVEEFKHCQGHSVDLGGYFLFDPNKAKKVMNPSPTLSTVLDHF